MEQLKTYFYSLSISKRIGILVLGILILSLPLVIIASQQVQETRQKASSENFITDANLLQAKVLKHSGNQEVQWIENATVGESYVLKGDIKVKNQQVVGGAESTVSIQADVWSSDGKTYIATYPVNTPFQIQANQKIAVIRRVINAEAEFSNMSFSRSSGSDSFVKGASTAVLQAQSSVPTASINGPKSATVGQSVSYTASVNPNGGTLKKAEIWAAKKDRSSASSWCPGGVKNSAEWCQVGTPDGFLAFNYPGNYYVVINVFNENGARCTGNPFGFDSTWTSCGPNSKIELAVDPGREHPSIPPDFPIIGNFLNDQMKTTKTLKDSGVQEIQWIEKALPGANYTLTGNITVKNAMLVQSMQGLTSIQADVWSSDGKTYIATYPVNTPFQIQANQKIAVIRRVINAEALFSPLYLTANIQLDSPPTPTTALIMPTPTPTPIPVNAPTPTDSVSFPVSPTTPVLPTVIPTSIPTLTPTTLTPIPQVALTISPSTINPRSQPTIRWTNFTPASGDIYNSNLRIYKLDENGNIENYQEWFSSEFRTAFRASNNFMTVPFPSIAGIYEIRLFDQRIINNIWTLTQIAKSNTVRLLDSNRINFTFVLEGIGLNDGNPSPINTSRNIKVNIFSRSLNRNIRSFPITGTISFQTNKIFNGYIETTPYLESGIYDLKITIDKYLVKKITGIRFTGLETSVNVPQTTFKVGDINGDNIVNNQDLAFVENCISNNALCDRQKADVNDNQVVDSVDYFLVFRNIPQQGD